MSKKAVFCIAASEFQAVCIVDRLKDADFLNTDTSLLFVDKTSERDFGYFSSGTKTPDGVTGAMLSGAMGWLSDVGALTFPGVGPVVTGGPVSTSLRNALIGGICGALIGMGIPEYEVNRYEAKIKHGGILIAVRVAGSTEAQLAENIFKEEDAQDIASSTEVFAPKKTGLSRRVASEIRSTNSTALKPALVGAGGSI